MIAGSPPTRLPSRVLPLRPSPGRLRIALGIVAVSLGVVAPATPQEIRAASAGPALVVAQGLSDTTVELLWTAVPGAATYTVYRDGTSVATLVGTLYDDAGLTALSTHVYQVAATVGGVLSAGSTPTTSTTQAPADTSPPSRPGAIAVSQITSSSATLKWAAATDNVRIEGYRILRGPAGSSPADLTDIDTTDAIASYAAKNLKASFAYEFGVVALDTGNNVSPIQTVTFSTTPSGDTTSPSKPPSLRAIPFSSSRIDLTWGASTATDIAGYLILRNGAAIGEVDRPFRSSYSDNGLAVSTSYAYTVEAIDSAGNLSSPSIARTASTLASGTERIVRGPYVQWVDQRSARVAWWTNTPTASQVSYGVGGLTSSAIDPEPRLEHVMLLALLTAGTNYIYTVGDGSLTSATATFASEATPGTSFSLDAIGDFGGGSPGETQNANLIAGDGSAFIQTLGDNIYPEAADPNFLTTYSDYDGRFYKPFGAAFAKKALWTADGNKEYYGNGAWWKHMWLPNNERWYSYDWGDAHILVLDTEQPFAPGTPQYTFAQSDLEAHQSSAWRIVALQRPPYSSSSANSSSVPVRTFLVPLFQSEHVSLVLSGNSHNYERTHPLIDGIPVSGGITYIVSGNGGNGFNTFTIAQPSWSAYRQASIYGHLLISVSPTAMTVAEIRADTGAALDSTTIGGPSDTMPPSAPTNLAAVAVAPAQVGLTWTASTDDVGVTGYDIYRDNAKIATVGSLANYTDSSVSPGTTHVYAVDAFDAAGNHSALSSTATVTTPPDITAPSVPTGLTTSSVTASGVTLSWQASTDDVGVTGYTVYRDGNPVATVGGPTTIYSDSGLSPATTYGYTVDAFDAAGNRSTPTSPPVMVTTSGASATLFSDGFETGSLSQWTSSNGLAIESVTVHGGTYAAEGNTMVGATYAKKTLAATYPTVHASLWFDFVSGSSQVNLLRLRTSTGTSLGYLFVNPADATLPGRLGLRDDAAGTTVNSTVVPGPGWHLVELTLSINGASSTSLVRLDGSVVSALSTTANWGTVPVGQFQIGEVQSGRIYDVLFDDAEIDVPGS
jgi:chitodextrinase